MTFSGPSTPSELADCALWRAASGHPGGWRVVRTFWAPLAAPKSAEGCHQQEAEGPSGRLRLFRTFEAAQAAARDLNAHSVEEWRGVLIAAGIDPDSVSTSTFGR